MISIKTPDEIKTIAQGGAIAAFTLKQLAKRVKPGILTIELDQIARRIIAARGAEPSFLGYQGYPAAICVSINDEVVHGIPSGRKIKSGDLVSIDVGIKYKNHYSDAALTVFVGNVSKDAKRLVLGVKEALREAIKIVKPGIRVGDIENKTGEILKKFKLSPVMELSGHGVGNAVHEEPSIRCDGTKKTGAEITEGMVLAIEPMAALGSGKVYIENDGWTVKSADHSLTAHFEHTICVTKKGSKILTGAI